MSCIHRPHRLSNRRAIASYDVSYLLNRSSIAVIAVRTRMRTLADFTFPLMVVPSRGRPRRGPVAAENARGTVRRSIMLSLVKQVWLARGTPQLYTVLEVGRKEGAACSRHAHRFSQKTPQTSTLPKETAPHLRRYS